MDHVGLFALDDEPDDELLIQLRELVRPLAEPQDGWSLVDVRTSDGGARVLGLTAPGSLAFNNVRGNEIWTLIHRACKEGRQAMVLDDVHLVVTTPDHVPLVPGDCQDTLRVCESSSSLRDAHEAFWEQQSDPVPLTEDKDRSFYRRDGSRVNGWIPGQRAILDRWPWPPFGTVVRSASPLQLRFAALSMVDRLFGQFLERPVRPVPDGLAEAFEAWLSDAWQLWAVENDNWASLDVAALAAFDGTLYGDEPPAALGAFDLAGRMSQPTNPSDQLGMAVFRLSSAITGPVRNSWWSPRTATSDCAGVSRTPPIHTTGRPDPG